MFFESTSGCLFRTSVAYVWRFQEVRAYSGLVSAAVLIAQAAQPAFFDIAPVLAVSAYAGPGAAETVSTVVVSMSPASGPLNGVVPSDLLCDCRAVLMDHSADRFKGKVFIEACRDRLSVFQCQMFMTAHPVSSCP